MLSSTNVLEATEVLETALNRFRHLMMGTALGLTGMVIYDLIDRLYLPVEVFTVDTGVLFPETYKFYSTVRERYTDNPLEVVATRGTTELDKLWETDLDACCRARKVEPARRALQGYDAWIVGLRRDQGPSRNKVQHFQDDCIFGIVKVAPLANWTEAQCWEYIRKHDVPYNPLHDEGYSSIGCWPCTIPAEGREGRWPGLAKMECGLHVREERSHERTTSQGA